MSNTADRLTRIDDETAEVMPTREPITRDAIILAREAAHRIAVDDLREIQITQAAKDSRIEVRARR